MRRRVRRRRCDQTAAGCDDSAGARGRPGGDRHRECRLQKCASNKRGVEHVLPEPTPDLLAEDDRERSAERRHPERKSRGKREAEQQSGDRRRAIGDRAALPGGAFREDRERHCGGDLQKCAYAEEPRRAQHHGDEASHHVPHDSWHRVLRPNVRRRRDIQFLVSPATAGFARRIETLLAWKRLERCMLAGES